MQMLPIWPFIIDAVLAIIFIVTLVVNGKKGFIRAVGGFLSLVIALGAGYFLSGPVGDFLNEKVVGDKVEAFVSERVNDATGITAVEQLKEPLEKLLKSFDIDFDEMLLKSVEKTADGVSATIADKLADIISKALAFIVVFIVVYILALIIVSLLDKLFKLKYLERLNTLFGVLIGIVKGAAYVILLCCLLCVALPIFGHEDIVAASKVLTFVGGFLGK